MVRKKVVKQRGHRTHGYGSPKKHRGKGSRGGKGWAGSEGHRMTYILKYARDRIGKIGFAAKTTKKFNTVNLREVVKLAGKEKKIDLAKFGYDKLLGTGEIKVPLVIKVDYCSAGAKAKVEAAGGKIVSDAIETEVVKEVVENTVE
ncbi:MAG: uL15 family ribosomal protein [Candidatus Aenigmarchaeota archaeon]|nr:uL15 family ribosomal protein [Candidatus Aenigmarchaeota archaeon]